MILNELGDWNKLSAEEFAALRPYLLDCEGLSAEASAEVRSCFATAVASGLKALCQCLRRAPSESEIDLFRVELTEHFNSEIIPAIAERERMAEWLR